jgi:energy-coupling factor transporter ATP-binding protein EcfA2
MRMILAACKQGVAAVVVTHDAQLASWADRVVFLRDGRVVDQTVPPPSLEALLEESSRVRAPALDTPPTLGESPLDSPAQVCRILRIVLTCPTNSVAADAAKDGLPG